MKMNQPRYNKDEFIRRAFEICDRDVAPAVSAEDVGRAISIDIETGNYEIGESQDETLGRLYAVVTDPQPFTMRVGKQPLCRIGGGGRRLQK